MKAKTTPPTIFELCDRAEKMPVFADRHLAVLLIHARLSPDVVRKVAEALKEAHTDLCIISRFSSHAGERRQTSRTADKLRNALRLLNGLGEEGGK